MNSIARRTARSELRAGSVSTYRYVLYAVNAILLVSTVVVMEWDRRGHESVAKRMEQFHLTTVTLAVGVKGEMAVVEDALVARALKIRLPDATSNSDLFLTAYPDAAASLYLAESQIGKIIETQSLFRGPEYKALVPRIKQQFFDLRIILSRGLFQHSKVETAQRQLTALTLSLEQLRRLHRLEHAELARVLPRQEWMRHYSLIAIVVGLLVISHVATRKILTVIDATEALQQSEERYRAVAEDMPVLISRFLPGGELTYVNDAFREYFEKSTDELVGHTFLSLVPESDRETVIDNIGKLTVDSPAQSLEHQAIAAGGELRWMRWTNRALFDSNGTAAAYQAIGEDITEQKQAKEELRLKQFAIDHSSLPIYWVKADGGIAYANQAACRSLGYGEEEILSMSVFDFDLDFPRDVWPENWEKFKESDSATFEAHHRTKLGRVFPVEITTNYLEHEGREYIWAYARDITERKQAEEALRKSEHQLSLITDNVPALIAYVNSQQCYQFVNRGYEELFGRPRAEIVGRHVREVVGEANYRGFRGNIERAVAGQRLAFEVPFHSHDHPTKWLHVEYVPDFDSTHQVRGFFALIGNITDRKLAEEEKRKLQVHLRHTQKMDAVGQLAAGVAHEFNNTLVGILGNAELLLATSGDDLPERFKQPLQDIKRSGTRAADLTKQLLSFARKKNPNVSLFDINQVIAGSKEMLRRLVGAGITLKTELASDPALIRADEAEIEQALLSLVMNARDAMPHGGTLAIRTDSTRLKENEVAPDCKPGRYVRLTVVDDGCGMPPEVSERIFEPFFTTKPVGEGTGLGLSTIFADVDNSGGFVKVESRVGEGTMICVHFPQAEGAIDTTGAGADHASRPIGGNETILVCDDDEIVLASITALLQTLGYPVICAHGPHEAIEAAEAHDGPISLLLTDVTMPGMDGIELGEEITRFYPDIKVVLTSGYAEEILRGREGENGRFRFLQKPVPYDTLARTFREVLD